MSWQPEGPVIVPIDFSGEGVEAIRRALAITGDADRVRVVHVLAPLELTSPGVLLSEIDDDDREAAVRERFAEVVGEHAHERHWQELGFDVRFGSPGDEVPRYAEATGASLIVVPSHGYGGFKRFLLGSVAERIIRSATCDVLVIRRSDAE